MTSQLTYEGFWDGLASFDESVLQSNGCLLKPEKTPERPLMMELEVTFGVSLMNVLIAKSEASSAPYKSIPV